MELSPKANKKVKVEGRLVGVTPQGRTAIEIAGVGNTAVLPSDDFMLQMTDMIVISGKPTQIIYDSDTEEVVDKKEF